VQPDGNIQLFVFNADVLFRPDDASLSPAGEMLMRSFGEVLRDQASYYTRIEIEGHADEQASRRFQREGDVSEDHGNWRLSAERAITVAQLLQRLGLSGEHLAVIGRSFYEPVNSRKAWEENRRIQVRLFYSEVLP
jgi:flagellar motor protein MotB